jgi:hypothetical protein
MMEAPLHRRSLAGLAAIGAMLGSLVLAAPASLADSVPSHCSSGIGDPAPGYEGPLLHGIACDYDPQRPVTEWTAPEDVTSAKFSVYGGDDPARGQGGQVEATLAVIPGENLNLVMGNEGGASSVSRKDTPLLVAGGGNDLEGNYVAPEATAVSTQPPDRPNPPYPRDGSVYVSWLEGWIRMSPRVQCVVPKLRGLRPAAARRALRSASCSVGYVDRHPARAPLRRRVVAQFPQPGTILPENAAVGFTVGRNR